MNKQTEAVLNYHKRTKHTLERYAKGPESLDWEDQPDQFRRFSGCAIISLPKPGAELESLFADLDIPETIPAQPLTLTSTALLLELAFGLSAWKQFGPSRWALRCNPSSGNLHPTEAYLISTGNEFVNSGVYHYVSHDHSLEQRCRFPDNAAFDSELLIGLSSIHWREAWKYGERAFRYCQHDIGHALGALRYAAATLGWSIEILADWSDDNTGQLLGLERDDFKKQEHEFPDIICRINTHVHNKQVADRTLLDSAQAGTWFGKANSLGAYHMYNWPIIEEVSAAASKPQTEEPGQQTIRLAIAKSSCTKTATQIIRQRRSAQQFDGKAPPLPQADFFRMLAAVLPTTAAFEHWRWSPKVHLFIFVHRVAGMAPGIYALPRQAEALEALQAATLPEFDWQKISEAIPLYQLHSGECRQIAKTLSCHQPIASDSAFSLGMVAEFGDTVQTAPWLYRRLFWECGLIGQVLYLEAEAAGVRGTGIGCFFDDSVHELLGFKDDKFQSLYHFTVGNPLEDKRIETLPAYGHLDNVA